MSKELKPRQCLRCGRVFYPEHYRQRYCSELCWRNELQRVIWQLREGHGEYYERWREGMRKAAERG
jgi:hypothetical protein